MNIIRNQPAQGHAWSPWEEVNGKQQRHCSRCGKTEIKGSTSCSHRMKYEPGTSPTCTEPGITAHYFCTVCMGLYEDEKGKKELFADDVIIPAAGHDPGEKFRENVKPATCTGNESYDEVVRCSVCGLQLSRETKTGKSAIGHEYFLSRWLWDGYASATALFACRHDPAHNVIVEAAVDEHHTEPTCTVNIIRNQPAQKPAKRFTQRL